MQTYTHFLLTKALDASLKANGTTPESNALLLGAIAPDLPLYGITALYPLWKKRTTQQEYGQSLRHLFEHMYFNDRRVASAHSFFHSPFPLTMMLIAGYVGRRSRIGRWLLWFATGCALHTLLDIPSHHNDGPLLLWPFDFKTRYLSPYSYWSKDHHGGIISRIEHIIDLAILLWWIWRD